jgi:hypothetical protein
MQQIVSAAVTRAFDSLGDLAKSAVFTGRAATGFDFGAGVLAGVQTSAEYRAVKVDTKRWVGGGLQQVTQLIVECDPGVLNGYTTVSFDGVSYRFKQSDGAYNVTTLELTR